MARRCSGFVTQIKLLQSLNAHGCCMQELRVTPTRMIFLLHLILRSGKGFGASHVAAGCQAAELPAGTGCHNSRIVTVLPVSWYCQGEIYCQGEFILVLLRLRTAVREDLTGSCAGARSSSVMLNERRPSRCGLWMLRLCCGINHVRCTCDQAVRY